MAFSCFNKLCLNMIEQFAVVRQIKRLPLGRKLTGPQQDDAVLGGV